MSFESFLPISSLTFTEQEPGGRVCVWRVQLCVKCLIWPFKLHCKDPVTWLGFLPTSTVYLTIGKMAPCCHFRLSMTGRILVVRSPDVCLWTCLVLVSCIDPARVGWEGVGSNLTLGSLEMPLVCQSVVVKLLYKILELLDQLKCFSHLTRMSLGPGQLLLKP